MNSQTYLKKNQRRQQLKHGCKALVNALVFTILSKGTRCEPSDGCSATPPHSLGIEILHDAISALALTALLCPGRISSFTLPKPRSVEPDESLELSADIHFDPFCTADHFNITNGDATVSRISSNHSSDQSCCHCHQKMLMPVRVAIAVSRACLFVYLLAEPNTLALIIDGGEA
jgi:hypothetical protein